MYVGGEGRGEEKKKNYTIISTKINKNKTIHMREPLN